MEFQADVNILIVDDRPENIISVESLIEGEGRRIYKAISGNDALKLTRNVNFDLILCDVQMPEMDGFEMLDLLRLDPAKKNIPFIFITAISTDDQYVHRGYSGGAVDYLFKPLNVDITRSKVDVFVELARQRKKLSDSNIRLQNLNEQKNQFIGMLAHDLRNPISLIHYQCSFLLDSHLKSDIKPIIDSIDESSMFMLNLVNDLLDITHIELGKMNLNPEPVDIKSLVENVIHINQLLAKEKEIKIDFSFSKDILPCMLDSSKMKQVLNNLITNAVKFSKEKTKIEVNLKVDGKKIFMEIIDQGQGIPEGEIEKLFKPFHLTSITSTAGEKSTGLGLYICSIIIAEHGGKINVESKVGEGSRFYFDIPFKKAPAAALKANAQNQVVKGKPKTALSVDDNNINQFFLKKLLEMMGHTVFNSSSGKEAIEIVKGHAIDVVFMDIEMPEMDGIEATKTILEKSKNKKIKIIGCTGHSDDSEIKEAREAGMINFLKKPINRDELALFMSTLENESNIS